MNVGVLTVPDLRKASGVVLHLDEALLAFQTLQHFSAVDVSDFHLEAVVDLFQTSGLV